MDFPVIVSGEEREIAANLIIQEWKKISYPSKYFPIAHDCHISQCELHEIEYTAFRISTLDGDTIAAKFKESLEPCHQGLRFDRVDPVFYCVQTGKIHRCGEAICEYNKDKTCPLTGIYFGEKMQDMYWSPEKYKTNEWKINVFTTKRKKNNELIDVREALEHKEMLFPTLLSAVRLAKFDGKTRAFSIAYAVTAILFCDERFEDAINEKRLTRELLSTNATRMKLRMEQTKMVPNLASILLAMPSVPRTNPLLVKSKAARSEITKRIAEHCVILWHRLFVCSDKYLAGMSFRNFCVALLRIFEQGYNAPDETQGYDRWIIHVNHVVAAFPMNNWTEKQIFKGMLKKNIRSLIRRSEEIVKNAIKKCICESRTHHHYLHYIDTDYETIPEDSFKEMRS